jgi:hypothetical protein
MVRLANCQIVLFLFSCLLLAAWGHYGSSLQRLITDPTGAAVSNAKVTATNQATGVLRDAVHPATAQTTILNSTQFGRPPFGAPGWVIEFQARLSFCC